MKNDDDKLTSVVTVMLCIMFALIFILTIGTYNILFHEDCEMGESNYSENVAQL